MKNHLYQLLFCALLALIPRIVPAADLPKLPTAPQVRTGQLDNGITYYLVKNSAEKGKAEVALVQRVGKAVEDIRTAGDGVVFARGALASLPHFTALSPLQYLSRGAIWPSEKGYVAVGKDATIYRFRDLTLPNSPDLVDSTLLMVFDIVARNDQPLYAPQNQAVVVSGDIDPDALLPKMNMLSLLVSRRMGFQPGEPYVWTGTDSLLVQPLPRSSGKSAELVVRYASARTPREDMATVQPLVSWRYMREFGILVRRRLSRALRGAGIPYNGLTVGYRSSADGPDDEQVEIRLSVDPQRYVSAAGLLTRTLATLDREGVIPEEYRDIQNELDMQLRREWGRETVTNAEYTDRCIAAFLYGASLAAPKTNLDFFLNRTMDGRAAADLFNSYAAALLDPQRNLTVLTDYGLMPPAQVRDLFRSAWTRESVPVETAPVVSHGDTLTLAVPRGRTRLRSDEQEPVSGGRLYTFANGIRVIYKQVPGKDMFHYTWLIKGGYSSLPGLKPGEGPYVADMLSLYNVADMKHTAFQSMLSANGITLEPEVTLTDFRLAGAAPSSRLPLLLKSLLALSQQRTTDTAAFDYYRQCLALGQEGMDAEIRKARLDSLVRPEALSASPWRRPIALSDDFPQRAERFFSGSFGRMNDGVLILVGNFEENGLKRILAQYLGGFKTGRAGAARFRSQGRAPAGHPARVDEGAPRPRIDLELTASLDFTVEHFVAAHIAARVLSDAVAETYARRGWYSEADWRFDLFPSDCFTLTLLASLADAAGMPASVMPVGAADEVMGDVKETIRQTALQGISEQRLKACKAELVNQYESWAGDPQTLIEMLVLRYSFSKDLMSKYSEKVAAVTREQVNRVLQLLASGASAEWMTRAAQPSEPLHEEHLEEPVWPEVATPLPPKDSTGILDVWRELFGEPSFPIPPLPEKQTHE